MKKKVGLRSAITYYYVSSSPHHHRGNGKVEAAVKSVSIQESTQGWEGSLASVARPAEHTCRGNWNKSGSTTDVSPRARHQFNFLFLFPFLRCSLFACLLKRREMLRYRVTCTLFSKPDLIVFRLSSCWIDAEHVLQTGIQGNRGIQGNTREYRGIQGIQGNTGEYRGIEEYKGIQGNRPIRNMAAAN